MGHISAWVLYQHGSYISMGHISTCQVLRELAFGKWHSTKETSVWSYAVDGRRRDRGQTIRTVQAMVVAGVEEEVGAGAGIRQESALTSPLFILALNRVSKKCKERGAAEYIERKTRITCS